MFSVKLCKYFSCVLAATMLLAGAQASQVLHDPTQPPGIKSKTTPQSQSRIRLDSVLVSKQRRVATINGRHYQEGDHVAGGKLTSIQRDGVEIAMPDKTLTLQLRQVVVKRKRN